MNNLFLYATASLIPLTITSVALGQSKSKVGMDISFDYQGTILRKSPAMNPEEKTDFVWGRFQSSNTNFHSTQFYMQRPDPSEPRVYEIRFNESVNIEGGELSVSQGMQFESDPIKTIEEAIGKLPLELKDSKASYFFEKNTDADSMWLSKIKSFPLLGFAENTDLRTIPGTKDGTRHTVLNGIEYIFKFDPDERFLIESTVDHMPAKRKTQASPKAPSTSNNPFGGPADPFSRPVDYIRSEAHYEASSHTDGNYTSKRSVVNQRRGHSAMELITTRAISNVSNSVAWPFTMALPPNDGDAITLLDSQQIAAAWLDGEIHRVYDGQSAEALASAEFKKPSSRYRTPMLVAGLLIAVASILVLARYSRGPKP